MTRPPVRLRRWRIDDVDALTTLANDREIWRNLRDRFPSPYTRADAEAWIIRHQDEDPQVSEFAIDLQGELVGAAGVEPKQDVYRISATIGFWVGRPYWGKGIATETVRQLTHHAFGAFPFERLEANVYEWNSASARVLEKNGYVLEGRRQRAVLKDGRVGDVLLYGRTRDASRGNHASRSSSSVPSTTAE